METDYDRPMTPEQASEWLQLEKFGYKTDTLFHWVEEGRLGHIKIGHKVAFLREHLVEFVRRGMSGTSAQNKLKKIR